jgi:pyruvate ferredoxin oxidoreductase gamma subunit
MKFHFVDSTLVGESMIEVRWHGRGGQGGFTASRLLGIAASLFQNKKALAFPSFGPERRGAPVLAFTKIDEKKIDDRSDVENCDYAVILDETLINQSLAGGMKSDCKIVINTQTPELYKDIFAETCKIFYVDATQIALDLLKRPITNTAMLGALASVSDDFCIDSCKKSIELELKPSLAEKNIKVIDAAFNSVKEYKRD